MFINRRLVEVETDMEEKSIEDDLREILLELRDVDGLEISVLRSNMFPDAKVENYRAGDITAGANKLADIWKKAYGAGQVELERLQEIERQLLYTLSKVPDAVRVREGGGLEDVAASVTITFSKHGLLRG